MKKLLFIFLWLLPFSANAESLKEAITSLRSKATLEGETVVLANSMAGLYQSRNFESIWNANRLNNLLASLAQLEKHGLNPEIYHYKFLEKISEHPKKWEDEKDAIAAEILATDAALRAGAHLSKGLYDAQNFRLYLLSNEELKALFNELSSNPSQFINQLLPTNSSYTHLVTALSTYKKLKKDGEWTKILDTPKLEPGFSGAKVNFLKKRLKEEGYNLTNDDQYDSATQEAVADYQRRTGLEDDGIAGKSTISALNTPIDFRIIQIEATLDQMRQYFRKQNPSETHIRVNVPEYMFNYFRDGNSVLEMKVVAGRKSRATPIFSGTMTYIDINPYWTVPRSIAVKDKLPKIQKDSEFFTRQGMKLYKNVDGEKVEVSPDEIDWSKVDKENFDYLIVQDPGDMNALGRIKFMFPNRHSVYLHDTPDKEYFLKAQRAYSSGCVRLDKPFELGELLLSDKPEWTSEKIQEQVNSGKPKTLLLAHHLPVHLVYWTAMADSSGQVNFREDVYGLNAKAHRLTSELK